MVRVAAGTVMPRRGARQQYRMRVDVEASRPRSIGNRAGMNTGESRGFLVSTGPDARSAPIVYIASSGPDSLIDSGKGVVDGRRLELPTSALRMRR